MDIKDDYYSDTAKNKPNQCDMCVLEDQRLFYIDHISRRSYWQPPKISWNCRLGFPYGWEEAMDVFGFPYYINHISKSVTYNDPRQGASSDSSGYFEVPNSQLSCKEISSGDHSVSGSYILSSDIDMSESSIEPIIGKMNKGKHSLKKQHNEDNKYFDGDSATEEKRQVKLIKDPGIGFGFVAASQMPVIVQYVTPNGPSDGKLYINDQICMVNDIPVYNMDKEEVVSMIREQNHEILLTVQQLPKKKKTNKKNFRVRFTDKIHVSNMKSSDFFDEIPNVMRVYLENGQTKSFKFDETTTVQDIVNNICSKLLIKQVKRFVLSLENSLSLRASKLCLLRPDMKICDLSNSAYVTYTRCRFRIAFMPQDIISFQISDPYAFDYLYFQCTNDVVGGRFSLEMKYEVCMRLAALQLRQLAYDNGNLIGNHVSINCMEKEYGLATFLPMILLENVKIKQIKKHLRLYLKKDEGNKRDERNFSLVKKCIQSELGSEEFIENTESIYSLIENTNDIGKICKLKYVEIVSLLQSFGGKTYNVTFKQTQVDMILQINHIQGLLIRQQGNHSQPTISVSYDLIEKIIITDETEILKLILIELKNNCHPGLDFLIDKEYAEDLVYYIIGYGKVVYSKDILCIFEKHVPSSVLSNYGPPHFRSIHIVTPSDWNYSSEVDPSSKMVINLINDPPDYEQAIKATTAYFNDSKEKDEVDYYNNIEENKNLIKNNEVKEENTEGITVEILQASNESLDNRREGNIQNSSFNLKFNDSIRLHKKRHSIVSSQINLSTSNTSLTGIDYDNRRSSTISFNINNINLLKSHLSNQNANSASHLSGTSINEEHNSPHSAKMSPVKSAKNNGITTVRRTSIHPFNTYTDKDVPDCEMVNSKTAYNINQEEKKNIEKNSDTTVDSIISTTMPLSDSSTIRKISNNHPINLFNLQEQDHEKEIIDLTNGITFSQNFQTTL
ncbi:FERM domain and WW domain and PDZ domain and FERM, N-terminal domain and FERM central domain and Band 4.1 domain-containing protein [Strongyloides ratti]|uniref:FERM domain and WW domain and PDZ domain and FERM, N-terminal domain and FERM central domain and Band 4.1 domain-containing protein n=1 Tax=Strongyloides ratti TaxID=34506 RepID=A0A090L595_STRRB|nr:FERM domain and WW domain and PDZ domain and FERM, N-terminal domain and FERM central domain and Band 4.1 domain-containing protein [Strongyloides ratti]CEF64897.1 FERM domain and WW domain and PDZ domain and FERM, N-terminal domain and FERM central domain and Band 4.1 domain-containing protein [Strongyloides ratti]